MSATNPTDIKWDIRFLGMAEEVSSWSKDHTHVGAVIVRPDHRVVSVGFNGFPQQMPDCQEWYDDRDEKLSRIIHAEMNALLIAERSVKGCHLYTYPVLSCDRCAVHMIQAGITRFVSYDRSWGEEWDASFRRTMNYARECGVDIQLYPLELLTEKESITTEMISMGSPSSTSSL